MMNAKEQREYRDRQEARQLYREKVARKAGSAARAIEALTGDDLISASAAIQKVYTLNDAQMLKLLGW